MKKSIIVLLLVAAMLLGITMAVSAESKGDHWAAIRVALFKLENAIKANEGVNEALADVNAAVSKGYAFLSLQHLGSSEINEISRFAGLATTDRTKYQYYLAQAHYFNNKLFGSEVTGQPQVTEYHS